jgi:hypothetical protein
MSGVVGIRLLYLAPGSSTRRHQHKRRTPRPTGAQSSARVPSSRWRSDRLLERLNPLPGLLIGFGLPAFLTIVGVWFGAKLLELIRKRPAEAAG